jgi:hypothetical protein
MKKILKTTIMCASPLVALIAQAQPAVSFTRLNPSDGTTVRSARTILNGKMSHDIYPLSLTEATLNGNPLHANRDGSFSVPITLKPGTNTFTLRASAPNPRQQTTQVSGFIDASMVYGSDEARAKALRTFQGGLLKTSAGDLPPLNTDGLENDNSGPFPDEEMFLAGDVRANENLELTAIHALFIREHNQLAKAIATANPSLSDEQIYQRARKLVAAEIQVITYREFLPALLGPKAVRPYRAYNPNINAGIATEFSTAAFRIGHTLINDDIEFFDNEGEEIREELPLAFAFFNPAPLKETGPDPLLKYLASNPAQEVDTQLVDGLRNFLFGPPGAGGLDLASLNIQRGRDHGLADYNTVRAAYGLPKVTQVSQITSDADLQAKLLALYGDLSACAPRLLDPLLPDAPTVAEQGFPGFDVGAWNALFVPRTMPGEAVARLEAECARLLAAPELRARLGEAGSPNR